MSDAEADPRSEHLRQVTITITAALGGIFAAVLSRVVTGDLPVEEAATDTTAYALLLLAILIQIPVYRVLGYEDFGSGRDIFYIVFMTFALWFVSYGIILTFGVEFL